MIMTDVVLQDRLAGPITPYNEAACLVILVEQLAPLIRLHHIYNPFYFQKR